MTEVVVRALIGGGVGAAIALVANIVFLPVALHTQQQAANDRNVPKFLQGILADGRAIKFIYRFVMPVMFIGVLAFVAVKLGEPA